MYKGSTGFNQITLQGARNLKDHILAFKDKIEVITVIMTSLYAKAHKKASVLAHQRDTAKKIVSKKEGQGETEPERVPQTLAHHVSVTG
mmetsp:Transcript_27583/g.55145  ORF Transcript_27583/g.55145 Transcript_27583/m.55145 type:complete len:89 (-) Transcript_27583:48-314(-)